MTRLTPLLCLLGAILLSSCSSEPDVLYESIDGLVAIETETWTDKQDSSKLTWSTATSDSSQIAKLGLRQQPNESATETTRHSASASLSYAIKFNESGRYYLWLRARAVNGNTRPLVKIAMTPATGGTAQQVSNFNEQWQWIGLDEYQNNLLVDIASSDTYTLSVATDDTNLQIDKIVLSVEPGYVPTGIGPSATLVDPDTAESGELKPDTSDQLEDGDSPNSVSATPLEERVDEQAAEQSEEQAHAESSSSIDSMFVLQDEMVNEQPQVEIIRIGQSSADQTVTVGQPVHLFADASDDGLPNASLYTYWTKVAGPGEVTFSDHTSVDPLVRFAAPGNYVLQVSANDTELYKNALIDIEVKAASMEVDSRNDRQLSALNLGAAQWSSSFAKGSPAKRHETSGVAVNGKMYVIGGRGNKPVDVYDSASNSWSQAAKPPIEMHHFQAVAVNDIIYVVGAATCCFPVEHNIGHIYQFDTRSGKWSKGASIPVNRRRGSTAAAVYNNKIYIVGGNTRGHSGGAVSWFDEFNPANGQWKSLANAPDARDHATIAVVGDYLVVAGGRRSAFPSTFGNTVGRTNIYDLKKQRWESAANIPTQRAGTMAVGAGSELVVIGGESPNSRNAHNAVEAFDINSRRWRRLRPLATPRHGGAAAIINNQIHVVAGSKKRGGAPETDAHEILK